MLRTLCVMSAFLLVAAAPVVAASDVEETQEQVEDTAEGTLCKIGCDGPSVDVLGPPDPGEPCRPQC